MDCRSWIGLLGRPPLLVAFALFFGSFLSFFKWRGFFSPLCQLTWGKRWRWADERVKLLFGCWLAVGV